MDVAGKPFNNGIFGLKTSELRAIAEQAESLAKPDDVSLDDLAEDAVHITARVYPSGGNNYDVLLVVVLTKESGHYLQGWRLTLHRDHLGLVYQREYALRWTAATE